MNVLNPQILVSVSALVVVMPPIFDGWLEAKIVNRPALLAFLVMMIGIFAGTSGGLLTQVAQGATWGDAFTVFISGTISGMAAGLKNWNQALAKMKAGTAAKVAAMILLCVGVPSFVTVGLGVAVSGCLSPSQQQAVTPAVSFGECVVNAALANDSLAQIIATCGSDVPGVINALTVAPDARIPATRAYTEAMSVRAMMTADGGAR